MKWLLLLMALTFAAPAFAQGTAQPAARVAGPATPLTPSPDERAKQWLGLVDDKNYNDAYKQMSVAAKGKTAMNAWTAKLGPSREALGAMASRDIKSVKLTKILPGMRDGQYATVQFDTSFAHKTSAVETIVLTSEKGAWSVISYSIS